MSNALKKDVVLRTAETMSMETFADIVVNTVPHELMPEFIARLDALCACWDISIELIGHFKALELRLLNEGNTDIDLSPKEITL